MKSEFHAYNFLTKSRPTLEKGQIFYFIFLERDFATKKRKINRRTDRKKDLS